MAGVILDCSGDQMAMSTAYKTALEITAGNNQVYLKSIEVSFADLTIAPASIQITRGDSGGTATARNPVKRNPDQQHTVLTLGETNFTVEGTPGTELREFELGPGGGTMFFGTDFVIGASEVIRIKVKHAASTTNVRVNAELEE